MKELGIQPLPSSLGRHRSHRLVHGDDTHAENVGPGNEIIKVPEDCVLPSYSVDVPDIVQRPDRTPRTKERIFPITFRIVFSIVAVIAIAALYWRDPSQRSDTLERPDLPPRADTLPRPDLPPRADALPRPDLPPRADALPRPDLPPRAHTLPRPDLPLEEAYKEVYSLLGSSSLPEAFSPAAIRIPLEQLGRERCDKQAIFDLATALQRAGYRRESANVDVTFSRMCGGYAPSLRRAANVLLGLSDYSGAETVASEVINLEPLYDNGYYLRALARDGSGLAEKALDDYVTTIELVGDKDIIISTPYFNMARLYEKLGQFCDAVLPIEAWVSLNPKHDTSQTRRIIANYRTKGRCGTGTSGSPEVFAIPRPNNIVNLPVTINGTRGTFILDTGATFVSLKNSFAQKASVEIDQGSIVRLRTANGIVDGKRGRAKTIQLRSLLAKDVPIVVQAGGDYGEGIDGLLGMSFLSRFNLNIDAKAVRISPRRAL
jgi:clan AA aspartic protease (TIGR02281 family)